MCGRYTLNKTADDVAKRFNLAKKPTGAKPNFNVAPTQTMPVITLNDDGKPQAELMKWGIPRMLGKDLVKELINTRADKAFGGFWRKTVMNHRCLVPATGFYEWKQSRDGKIPFFIHPKDDDLFAFAGIWSVWKDQDGHELNTYSIMTTEPNQEMRSVHDRMPVILHPEDESTWIAPAHEDVRGAIEALLRPYEDNGLEMFEVSRDVNVVRNNYGELLTPINSQ
jgi:putative SOS response-associated peptidase YedK